MVQLIYIFLKVVEFAVFIIFGKKILKVCSSKEYWKLSVVPILTYSLIEGLRFGRKIDWNVYYFRYEQLGQNVNFLDDYEPLFRYICHILYQLGIPYPGFIFLQCLFFIICVFVVIENFKGCCRWIVPLILVCATGNEMFIRWFLSFSFVLLSLNSFIKKKYIYTAIWFFCAFSCHSGIIVFALFFILYKFFNSHTLPPIAAVVLLFVTTFIMSLSDLMFITQITYFLSPILGDSLNRGGYLDATENILSGTWGHVGVMEQSKAFYFRIFLMHAPVIYWGREFMRDYKLGYFIYNLFVIGAICSPLFVLIEIFNRISGVLAFFFCIVGGVFYFNILGNRGNTQKVKYYFAIISLFFAIYPYFSDMFSRPDNLMLFLWDANGRNFLPYW